MMYAVITYANMRGVRDVDRIVELCERNLDFIWLTKGQKSKWDAFYDFKGKKLTGEVLDELNYQFLRRMKKEGPITLKELFIDGTKIEANTCLAWEYQLSSGWSSGPYRRPLHQIQYVFRGKCIRVRIRSGRCP